MWTLTDALWHLDNDNFQQMRDKSNRLENTYLGVSLLNGESFTFEVKVIQPSYFVDKRADLDRVQNALGKLAFYNEIKGKHYKILEYRPIDPQFAHFVFRYKAKLRQKKNQHDVCFGKVSP